MLAIIIFILIIGLLIFVHELGHFVSARRNGIRAEEFGFGFPPRIIGIQRVEGKKRQEVAEIESIEVEKLDIKQGREEILKETIVERVRRVVKKIPVRKWRIIWGRHDGDSPPEKADREEIEKNKYSKSTIYSLNWIPLGGFVRIKGENGNNCDADSFAVKGAWTRTKVLAAGVIMNFLLAWALISFGLMIGAPEPVESGGKIYPNSKIQISAVVNGSPAETMGLKPGDEIVKNQSFGTEFKNTEDIQNYIQSKKGQEIELEVKRGGNLLALKGTPRLDVPENQGPLGISFSEIIIVKHPWYEAIYSGAKLTADLVVTILNAFWDILKNIFTGQKIEADIAGPVGIAAMTGSVASLGLVYLINFTALLSINLGIINALPIPALDGGRILFIIIEKIKGRPVSQRIEQVFHTTFFVLLITLMILVTFRDVVKFIK